MKQFRTLSDIMMERLSDPENAVNYLKICVEEYLDDGDLSFLLKEIKSVIEAQGGINKISKFIDISPRELDRIIFGYNSLQLNTIYLIIKSLRNQVPKENLTKPLNIIIPND